MRKYFKRFTRFLCKFCLTFDIERDIVVVVVVLEVVVVVVFVVYVVVVAAQLQRLLDLYSVGWLYLLSICIPLTLGLKEKQKVVKRQGERKEERKREGWRDMKRVRGTQKENERQREKDTQRGREKDIYIDRVSWKKKSEKEKKE